jgi:hypothetical protein
VTDGNERKADKQVNLLKDGNSDKADLSDVNFQRYFKSRLTEKLLFKLTTTTLNSVPLNSAKKLITTSLVRWPT